MYYYLLVGLSTLIFALPFWLWMAVLVLKSEVAFWKGATEKAIGLADDLNAELKKANERSMTKEEANKFNDLLGRIAETNAKVEEVGRKKIELDEFMEFYKFARMNNLNDEKLIREIEAYKKLRDQI